MTDCVLVALFREMTMATDDLSLAGVRILLLDDNQHMREVLASLLAGLGCDDVSTSDTVKDALERVMTFKPDLVITDFQLADETGADFLKALRANSDELVASLPVIFATSHTEPEEVLALTSMGADEVIGKPVTADALYRAIATVASERRQFVKTRSYFGPDRRLSGSRD